MANFMYEHTELNIYNQQSRDVDKQFYPIRSPLYPQEPKTMSSDLKPPSSKMLIQDIAAYSTINNFKSGNQHQFKVNQVKAKRTRKNIPNSMSFRPISSTGLITPMHVPVDPSNIYSSATRQ